VHTAVYRLIDTGADVLLLLNNFQASVKLEKNGFFLFA